MSSNYPPPRGENVAHDDGDRITATASWAVAAVFIIGLAGILVTVERMADPTAHVSVTTAAEAPPAPAKSEATGADTKAAPAQKEEAPAKAAP